MLFLLVILLGVGLIRSFFNINRNNHNRQNRTNESRQNKQKYPKKPKVFDDNEGEYVDFEEVE